MGLFKWIGRVARGKAVRNIDNALGEMGGNIRGAESGMAEAWGVPPPRRTFWQRLFGGGSGR